MPMAKIMRNWATDTARKGSALLGNYFERLSVARAETIPSVPTVFDEKREAGHPNDVEAVDNGFAGHHLFSTVRPWVAVRGHASREHWLEEANEQEWKDDQDHNGQWVASE